ncbi:MAG: hypothetical protein EPN41_04760 [Candidimonas sp.]|nr:MAG: hypothetical protein EPN41_04760 [Candidimonas sp.]
MLGSATNQTYREEPTVTENPFGDTSPRAGKRGYLLLMSAGKDNAKLTQTVLKNVQSAVDENASVLWIDSKGIGIFVSTELVAAEIWTEAMKSQIRTDFQDFRDMLIVEIGADWMARKDARTEHWLTTHVGKPREIPYERRRRPQY